MDKNNNQATNTTAQTPSARRTDRQTDNNNENHHNINFWLHDQNGFPATSSRDTVGSLSLIKQYIQFFGKLQLGQNDYRVQYANVRFVVETTK